MNYCTAFSKERKGEHDATKKDSTDRAFLNIDGLSDPNADVHSFGCVLPLEKGLYDWFNSFKAKS